MKSGFFAHLAPLRLITATICVATAVFAPAFRLPAHAQDLPSYGHPSYSSDEETIHGHIAAIHGAYELTLHDDRGFLDIVTLHRGTIIIPRGTRLISGMNIVIIGHNDGPTFAANEISTPYAYSGPNFVSRVHGMTPT